MTTAAVIRRDHLEPVLDAIAHNFLQARLIANPSPEIDSIAEHFAAAARSCTPKGRRHLSEALVLLKEVLDSNEAERAAERHVASAADQLVTDLRRAELNPGDQPRWTAKQIARALRPHLEVLCRDDRFVRAEQIVAARDAVAAVMQAAPAGLLLSITVRHELGVAKYTRLTQLAEEAI